MVEDVVHLGRGEPPVDGDDHRIELGRTIGQREVLGDVLADEADPVLVADAGRGKGVGHLVGLAIELGEREGAIVEDEGDLVRLFVALATQVLGEVEHDDDSLVGSRPLSRTNTVDSTHTAGPLPSRTAALRFGDLFPPTLFERRVRLNERCRGTSFVSSVSP